MDTYRGFGGVVAAKQGLTHSKLPPRGLFVILSQLCFDMTKLQYISLYI